MWVKINKCKFCGKELYYSQVVFHERDCEKNLNKAKGEIKEFLKYSVPVILGLSVR